MRSIFSFVLCILGFGSVAQQANHAEEIMQIKGKWTKHATVMGSNDPYLSKSQYPLVQKRTEAIAALLKESYPDPRGLEAIHYSNLGHWPLYVGAPFSSYMLNSHYMSYYFNEHLKKIWLADETATVVRFHINDFGAVFMHDYGEWLIDGQKIKVWASCEVDGEWKGYTTYKYDEWRPGNQLFYRTKIILISRDGEVPYIPVTQKQFLLATKQMYNDRKKQTYDGFMKGETEMPKIIEETRNNKYLDPQAKEKMIASFQKQFDEYRKTQDANIKKSNDYYDEKIKIVDQYLATHTEQELKQPAATVSMEEFSGFFGPERKKRVYYPVRINPDYFRKNLPRYVPQFIVVEWNCQDDAPAVEFRKQFEEKFPVDKLKAMIDYNGDSQTEKKLIVKKTDPAKDPELKAIRKKAEKYADSLLHINKQISAMATFFPADLLKKPPPDTTFRYNLPTRSEKWIRAIPGKKLSAGELRAYLEAIDKKYTTLLQSRGVTLPDISGMNVGDISYSSGIVLLNGQSEQAAWLAIKAAQKAPGNILVLNNSGAVLNACGFQPVAVPVLETALEKSPGNSNIQNNLGQAHLGLGDIQKATQYLQQSVSSNPYHPHANLSLAYIHYSRGDKGSALKYAENSLHGSYNDGAMHLLMKLNPDARLIKYLKDRYKPPEYFNEDKYHLPSQCEKVSEIGMLKGEYAAFSKMVEKVKNEFEAIAREENELGLASMRERVRDYKKSTIMRTPFTELGYLMLWDRVYLRIHDEQEKLSLAQHIYNKTIAELNKAYKAAEVKADDCGEEVELANRYMELMAFATREYQKYWMPFWREVFDDMAFWTAVAYPDKHVQRGMYAGAVSGFLGEILRMAETHFLEPRSIDCADTEEKKKDAEEYKMPEAHCPIDVNLDFVIGSFSLDCEKIEYHFSSLIIAADAVHSFRNHRTTIAIGSGLELKFGSEKLKAGPIQGGFGVKGKMQYYLTFDGTHPSDQGIIWEEGIKYQQKIKTGIEVETVFSDIKDKVEGIKTTSSDLSAKTVLSFHNGWTFDGTLYEQLDKILEAKSQKQVNKNIKIYNPQ